jgi:hypothetical protein
MVSQAELLIPICSSFSSRIFLKSVTSVVVKSHPTVFFRNIFMNNNARKFLKYYASYRVIVTSSETRYQ